jgi:quinohemoprotein ethanol dehydrogenase
MILADLKIGGADRHVLMQANKNGFFYVLDRASGELLSAKSLHLHQLGIGRRHARRVGP